MNSKQLSTFLFFVIAAISLILFKLDAITLPYYWDEIGVYGRAVLYMYDNGLGLLPATLPPEISRGHPLLFHFIYALLFNVFGTSVIVGHSISLAFSIILLYVVFKFASDFFNRQTAFLATLILITQPLFVAQSIFVLPEIMLTIFMLLACYFYLHRQFYWMILFSSCAIMVKETGIVITATIILYEIIQNIINKETKLLLIKRIMLFSCPIYVYLLFLIIQKLQNGWYFFPLHISTEVLNFDGFTLKLKDYLRFIFIQQGRIFWSVIFLAGIIISFVYNKKKAFFNKAVGLLVVSTIVMLIFSSINFYMNRYMMIMITVWSILTAYALQQLYNYKLKIIFLVLAISLSISTIALPLFYMNPKEFKYDEDMSYKKVIDVQQKTIKFLEENLNENEKVYVNFPLNYSYADKRLGYSSRQDITFTTQFTPDIQYCAFIDPGTYNYHKPEGFLHLRTFSSSFAKVKLFKKARHKP